VTTELIVFFDGGCPLCSREIAHYQRLDKNERIRWIDITREGDLARSHGIDPREAMALFHVIDGAGRTVKGAAGFVAVWRELPGYRWLAGLCSRFHLLPVMEWLYGRFARWHFQKRCRVGACGA